MNLAMELRSFPNQSARQVSAGNLSGFLPAHPCSLLMTCLVDCFGVGATSQGQGPQDFRASILQSWEPRGIEDPGTAAGSLEDLGALMVSGNESPGSPEPGVARWNFILKFPKQTVQIHSIVYASRMPPCYCQNPARADTSHDPAASVGNPSPSSQSWDDTTIWAFVQQNLMSSFRGDLERFKTRKGPTSPFAEFQDFAES